MSLRTSRTISRSVRARAAASGGAADGLGLGPPPGLRRRAGAGLADGERGPAAVRRRPGAAGARRVEGVRPAADEAALAGRDVLVVEPARGEQLGEAPRAGERRSPRGPCRRPRTTTSSQCATVESRCATRMPIRPRSSRSVACWTRCLGRGVEPGRRLVEDDDVGSRTRIRANATSCSWPADSTWPPSPSRVPSPSGSSATQASRPELGQRRAGRGRAAPGRRGRRSRRASRRGSRCAAGRARPSAAAPRRRGRATSWPPRKTVPRGTSTARVRTLASVDLPEPVRPTSA